MSALTEGQSQLIAKLKAYGYGWAKFAASVEKQGRCTEKQEETMCRMLQRLETPRQPRERGYRPGITEGEIMSFGLEI